MYYLCGMEEKWKDIEGYEGLYIISNLGTIKNNKGDLKALRLFKNGYLYVGLWKKGASKTLLIHRLVAKHFIHNIYGKRQVNHIDGDKLNNTTSNLEWVTDKENKIHAVKTGLFHTGGKHHNSKKVIDTKSGVIYGSARTASIETNINYSTLRAYLNGALDNKTNLIYYND